MQRPGKWRIIGARADAWIEALTADGLATVERDVALSWPSDGPRPARSDLIVPATPGALGLVLGRTTTEDSVDFGVVIGVVIGVARGASVVATAGWVPHCGCDACDSGSASELELLDERIIDVVSGAFRQLTRGRSTITVGRRFRSAERPPRRGIDRVLADPSGWHEVSGVPWR